MKITIRMTYRGIPYEAEMEASDEGDLNLQIESFVSINKSMQQLIDRLVDTP